MNKEEFRGHANQMIDEITTKINALKEKMKAVDKGSRSNYKNVIKELESTRTELQKKYALVISSAGYKTEDAKKSFSDTFDSFKEGLDKVASIL